MSESDTLLSVLELKKAKELILLNSQRQIISLGNFFFIFFLLILFYNCVHLMFHINLCERNKPLVPTYNKDIKSPPTDVRRWQRAL